MAACCTITYGFLSWFLPQTFNYTYSDVDNIISELSELLSNEYKENAYIWLENTKEFIDTQYENEFTIHLFQDDGKEVFPEDVSQPTNKSISDYRDTSKQYTLTFLHDQTTYTLLLSRNQSKNNQIELALKKALPPLYIFILIISICVSFLYTRYITVPIRKLSALSSQMAMLNFDYHFRKKRKDEIGTLGNNLNILSDKLEATLSELQSKNEKLLSDINKERELEHQRLEFFSAISHELKTPITIIKGQLQGMLYDIGRYQDHKKYLADSITIAEKLESMVQDLLTVARLETLEYPCIRKSFNISHFLNTHLNIYEDLFVEKNIEIKKNIESDIYIYADSQLIQKVFDNLYSNAIYYSPPNGTISINLCREKDNILFFIENYDSSIPEDSIPKLFDAFYRVDQSRSRQTGGSGLGLYIVKTILDLHDAPIKIINSEHGVKAIIYFCETSSHT